MMIEYGILGGEYSDAGLSRVMMVAMVQQGALRDGATLLSVLKFRLWFHCI
jgi:hypothetical protein